MLVNRLYRNWSKLSNALSNHSLLGYHRKCLQEADALRDTMNDPTCRVDVMTNASVQVRTNENKHIIRQIVRAVLFLAKQGLPFQGDVEDFKSNKNPGNFLALLKDYAATDNTLFDHLNSPRAKNATYISPSTQNDNINISGNDFFLSSVVAEIQSATYYSVLADEVNCHNVEHC